MLVYVEQYKFEDISKRWGLRDRKIVVSQLQGVVQKEMLLITALDSAIGTLTSGGKLYLINRNPTLGS